MQFPELPEQPFIRSELSGLSLTTSLLNRGLATGHIRRVLRGVYVAGAVPDSLDLRLRAARRVIAPGHVACDRTAAWIHGVDVLEGREIPPIEVCALRWHPATEQVGVLSRNRDLIPADIDVVDGFHVTTPLRTALDLGCILRRRDALATLDQFRRAFGFTERDLLALLPRYFRRRGVVQLRALIPVSDPRAESPRESWTRLEILDAGLPAPEPQYRVDMDGGLLLRLDHAYPASRVAVEYDGWAFHSSDEQVEHDRLRRAWLSDNGWRFVVVRRGDFTGRRRDRWIDELRSLLAAPYSNLRW